MWRVWKIRSSSCVRMCTSRLWIKSHMRDHRQHKSQLVFLKSRLWSHQLDFATKSICWIINCRRIIEFELNLMSFPGLSMCCRLSSSTEFQFIFGKFSVFFLAKTPFKREKSADSQWTSLSRLIPVCFFSFCRRAANNKNRENIYIKPRVERDAIKSESCGATGSWSCSSPQRCFSYILLVCCDDFLSTSDSHLPVVSPTLSTLMRKHLKSIERKTSRAQSSSLTHRMRARNWNCSLINYLYVRLTIRNLKVNSSKERRELVLSE